MANAIAGRRRFMWFELVLLLVLVLVIDCFDRSFDHEQEHERDYEKAKPVALSIICFIFAPL